MFSVEAGLSFKEKALRQGIGHILPCKVAPLTVKNDSFSFEALVTSFSDRKRHGLAHFTSSSLSFSNRESPSNITHCVLQTQCFWSENEFRMKSNCVRLPYIPNIMICLHLHSSFFLSVAKKSHEMFCFCCNFHSCITPLSPHPNPLLPQLSFNDFFMFFFFNVFIF